MECSSPIIPIFFTGSPFLENSKSLSSAECLSCNSVNSYTMNNFHVYCTDCVTYCTDCVTYCTDCVTYCTDCVTYCADCGPYCTDCVTLCRLCDILYRLWAILYRLWDILYRLCDILYVLYKQFTDFTDITCIVDFICAFSTCIAHFIRPLHSLSMYTHQNSHQYHVV